MRWWQQLIAVVGPYISFMAGWWARGRDKRPADASTSDGGTA